MRAYIVFVLGLVLGVLVAPIHVSGATLGYWKPLDVNATAAVLYDFDGDGDSEVILAPDHVVDGYVVLASPYLAKPRAALSDVDADDDPELLLYGAGEALIYDQGRLLLKVSVPDTEPVLSRYAVAFGRVVIWKTQVYTVEAPVYGSVVPAASPTKLYMIYTNGSALIARDAVAGEEVVVYPDFIEPIAAGMGYNVIGIVGKTRDGYLVYITYNPETGETHTAGFAVPVERTLAFNPLTGAFYIEAYGMLYRVTANSIVLVSDWKPLSSDYYGYIYLYKSGELAIYNIHSERTASKLDLPEPGAPDYVGAYPLLTVIYSGKPYTMVWAPVPTITLITPRYVYVGEPFKVYASVTGAQDWVMTLDGVPVEPGEIVINEAGTHVIAVMASSGVINVTQAEVIYAIPRPLYIALNVIDTRAFGPITVEIQASDHLTGEPVNTTCTLTVGEEELEIDTWVQTQLPILASEPVITASITCGDDTYYQRVTREVTIVPDPVTPEYTIEYLGGGTVSITFHAPGDQTAIAPGTVIVRLDNATLYAGANPAEFTLEPGEHIVTVAYESASTLFRNIEVNVTVSYYPTAEAVPPTATSVAVADRTITKTEVIYRNQTVTTTYKETVTVPKTVEVRDLKFTIAVSIMVGIAAIAATYALLRAPRREGEVEITV